MNQFIEPKKQVHRVYQYFSFPSFFYPRTCMEILCRQQYDNCIGRLKQHSCRLRYTKRHLLSYWCNNRDKVMLLPHLVNRVEVLWGRSVVLVPLSGVSWHAATQPHSSTQNLWCNCHVSIRQYIKGSHPIIVSAGLIDLCLTPQSKPLPHPDDNVFICLCRMLNCQYVVWVLGLLCSGRDACKQQEALMLI